MSTFSQRWRAGIRGADLRDPAFAIVTSLSDEPAPPPEPEPLVEVLGNEYEPLNPPPVKHARHKRKHRSKPHAETEE